ncbi:MAG: hypothetical protein P3W94_002350 [Paracoccus sp. (in: a-proteobacteria)]|nr:hypothetical protein [Paracoccus sp. (in: a-proteobacteria)]
MGRFRQILAGWFLLLLRIEWRGKPCSIRVDDGPNYIGDMLQGVL